MPSSCSPSSSPPSSSSSTLTPRRKLTTTLLLIFSLLSRLFKTLIFSIFTSFMDDFFDFGSSSSSAAADDADDFLLRSARRRRLAGSSPPSVLSLRHDRLFFVPLKWWEDAKVSEYKSREGVLYTASSSDDDLAEAEVSTSNDIVLRLKKQCGGSCVYDNDDDEKGGNDVEEDDQGELFSGREFALISESMWFKALKWHSHNFCSRPSKDKGVTLHAEDYSDREVFPLQVRLSVLRETLSLLVKISPMDNSLRCYERACQIFDTECGPVHIWDFSGQMTQFFEGFGPMLPNGGLDHAVEEVLLELQVYGFRYFCEGKQVRKAESAEQEGSRSEVPYSSFSTKLNGIASNDVPSPLGSLHSCDKGYGETGILGLTGLVNLGNTCFMNSAIQCLAHTPEIVDYFLGDYKKEINYENPLGMNGELALAFGDLLRKLWVPGGMPVAPKLFKYTLENFAPQFSGYNQHDSQELLSFLLDGLHEDLNRVKHKPYIEAIDAVGRPDEMVADEYWRNHLARNNSIIVDMCHGQYRSTLVCPICKRVSVTFDPFMYLSLPLPSTTMRTMTVTIISTDGSSLPSSVTVTVPKCGRCEDLVHALGTSCSLRDDETLLVAEVYNHLILRFLEDPFDSLALIRDGDCLVAYRLPKERESCQLVVFINERSESYVSYGKERSCGKFGIPFVARVSNLANGYQIRDEYMKLFRPFLNMDVDDYDDVESSDTNPAKMEASMLSSDDSLSSDEEARADLHICSNFQFHFTDERGIMRGHRIKLSKPLNFTGDTEKLNVLVSWPENMVGRYDTSHLSLLPEVFRRNFSTFKMQESVSLYKCLEGFLKEEPLGPEDMWYCPSCKQHQQASKKLDLWRLPEILVVHLKRFSYSRFLKNKLETFVDFPIDKLDLAGFLAHKNSQHLDCYRLFAVSNHYGSLGGGHYTALAYHGSRWYEFNDSLVEPIKVEDVKSSAAYVLFYRRISDTHSDTNCQI
ncbi:ubiquitin carboxyl-terminal hydrolase 8-like [Silene latifolia]|uniref:ubiquitin carboxyl-terminal hydrolase 8-like n=1 Tax=Silene latifolia TaxID=37657 RepID=UPI003D77E9E3